MHSHERLLVASKLGQVKTSMKISVVSAKRLGVILLINARMNRQLNK